MSSRVNNDSYHHHFSTNQLSSLFGNSTAEIPVEKRPLTGDPLMTISYEPCYTDARNPLDRKVYGFRIIRFQDSSVRKVCYIRCVVHVVIKL